MKVYVLEKIPHKIFFLFLFLALVFACKKKESVNVAQHPIPYVPVAITLYPNDPLYFKLQAIGGWMYIDGGINGVIVYRKSEQEFVSIERSSSKTPSDSKARTVVLSDNFTLHDTVNNAKWRIIDGAVIQNAEWALRLYGSTYDGNVLRIRN